MICIIDRATWGTGARIGGNGSMLVNRITRQKCCLGFLGNACGLEDSDMNGRASPGCLNAGKMWAFFPFLIASQSTDTSLANELMRVNDSCRLSDVAREVEISRLMYKAGINVVYVGSYPL